MRRRLSACVFSTETANSLNRSMSSMRTSSLVRDEGLPVLWSRIVLRRGHDREIRPGFVGADIKQAFAMVQVIAVAFSRGKNTANLPAGWSARRYRTSVVSLASLCRKRYFLSRVLPISMSYNSSFSS